MRELHTEVEISAPPATVWDVLTDLDAHATWNPFMVQASGDVKVGAKLRILMQPVGGKQTTFKPTVTVVEPTSVFEWLGSLPIPGMFTGRHRFELVPTDDGTRFVQSESFRGLLLPLLSGMLKTRTKPAFEAMNDALKLRAEARVRNEG